MDNKEEEHRRALAEEKSEVTRLQRELDRVVKVKDKVKSERDAMRREKESAEKERDTLKAGLAKRAESDKKIQTLVADAEAKARAAKDELAAHEATSAKWLAELASLNEDMDRKRPDLPFLLFSCPNTNFVFLLIKLGDSFAVCRRVHQHPATSRQSC
jgi:DNA repair exonuclease SbcCD ATPase subunit